MPNPGLCPVIFHRKNIVLSIVIFLVDGTSKGVVGKYCFVILFSNELASSLETQLNNICPQYIFRAAVEILLPTDTCVSSRSNGRYFRKGCRIAEFILKIPLFGDERGEDRK